MVARQRIWFANISTIQGFSLRERHCEVCMWHTPRHNDVRMSRKNKLRNVAVLRHISNSHAHKTPDTQPQSHNAAQVL